MIILAVCFLALFAVAEVLYGRYKVKAEITRKIVHIGTGLLTLLFPLMLANHWWVLLLCSAFAVLLMLSLKFNFLPSINNVGRDTVGSLAYPLSVYVCYLFYEHFDKDIQIFYLPILILAICDPLAALAGNKLPLKYRHRTFTGKTFAGSLAFFICAFAVSFIILVITSDVFTINIFIKAFCLALVTATAEAVTLKGYDNVAIPLSAIAILYLFKAVF